jgi:hypothetical protein
VIAEYGEVLGQRVSGPRSHADRIAHANTAVPLAR